MEICSNHSSGAARARFHVKGILGFDGATRIVTSMTQKVRRTCYWQVTFRSPISTSVCVCRSVRAVKGARFFLM